MTLNVPAGEPKSLSPTDNRDGADYSEMESKDPTELTDLEKFALNGKPRLGEFRKCQVSLNFLTELNCCVLI